VTRDDFSKSVINKLRLRVGNHCSSPDCGVNTSSASNEAPIAVNNIGVAAHISAASKGGKRYLPSLSKSERASIENGIWLCQSCSVKIDRDEAKYTIELLKNWKCQAEAKAQQELGRPPPQRKDAVDAVVAALSAKAVEFNESVIPNVVKAEEAVLEALDPAFSVKASHVNGLTSYQIIPKQNGSFKLTVRGKAAQELLSGHRALLEHAEPISLDVDDFTLEGSKLFETILGNAHRMSINLAPTNKVKAIQKLWLQNDETGGSYFFDDVIGEITAGSKTFTFAGCACNDFFTSKLRCSISGSPKADVSLSIHLSEWDRVDVLKLNFFPKLHSLFEKLVSKEWRLFSSIEVNGQELISSNGYDFSGEDFVKGIWSHMHYLELTQELTRHLGLEIIYDHSAEITEEDYIGLLDAVDIINNDGYRTHHSGESVCSTEIVIENKEAALSLLNPEEPINIQLKQTVGDELTIMGQKVQLPPREALFEHVTPSFDCELASISEGKVINVGWQPADGYRFRVRFIEGD